MFGGIIIGELGGAWWHRHVSHLGALKRIANDGIRARHRNHHIEQHGPTNYGGVPFRLSCEMSFPFFVGAAAVVLSFGSWSQLLSITTLTAIAAGAGLHGILLKQLHHWAHREESATSPRSLSESLRAYHETHHYVLANFGICPLADWLFGTYVDPRHLPALKQHFAMLAGELGREGAKQALTERLFPRLAPGRTSDCTVAMSENVHRLPI